MRGNLHALFGKRPTEKDPAKGTSPAVDFTPRGGRAQQCARPTRPSRASLDDLRYGFGGGQSLALSSPDSMARAGFCQIAIAVFMRRKPSLP